MKLRILLVLYMLCSLAFAADFSGSYEATSDGEKYTLTLTQTGDALSGEAKGEGQVYKLKGKVAGDKAAGTVTINGIPVTLHFKAEKSGAKLKLIVAPPGDDGKPDWGDADEYAFTAVASKEPAPTKKESVLSRFSKQPTDTLKNGKEYVHASGGKFRYPATWKLQEMEAGLQLTPPDAGADEVYVILAESAEGATDPASKDVVAYVEGQVQSQLPFVKRVGQIERATVGGGKGAIVTWEGKKDGNDIQVRGYLTILKGYGVALVAAGPKSKVEKRDKALRDIFFTFGWGQGKVDTNLVGTWNHWSYKGTNGYGREESAKAVLNADGTFSYSSSAETAITATTGSMASRRGSGWSGTWTADGSTLIFNFADGTSETFTYRFKQEANGNVFLVVTEAGGGKPMEWSRGK